MFCNVARTIGSSPLFHLPGCNRIPSLLRKGGNAYVCSNRLLHPLWTKVHNEKNDTDYRKWGQVSSLSPQDH